MQVEELILVKFKKGGNIMFQSGVLIIIIVAFVLVYSIKIVNQWEKLTILTLGKFTGLKGPGMVIIIPFIQTVATRIDMRVLTSIFQSETTLTKDGVAVTVQAVLFWKVIDATKATLEVNNYRQAVELAAQTSMRDVIGRMNLPTILSNLEELDLTLKDSIARKVGQWGIDAQAVEIRDVSIPKELQEVMSRSAQAEREKQARVIYGEAEVEAAREFVKAAEIYASNPSAMQLRAMSIMYEAVKSDQNTLIMVPSNVPDAFNPTSIAAAVASTAAIKLNINPK
jgi:regulator of protease activity HflC (stomatin/prohibitin superfamily)